VNPDLERRLQALRPAAPPPDLLKQILESEPPAPGKIRWLRLLAPLAAAAAVAALVALVALPLLRPRHPVRPQPVAASAPTPSDFLVFVPIARTSTLLDVHNISVLDVNPSRPVRFVRATWLDDTTYAGDDGHSTLHRREPRTAIVPMPLDSL
jgi:hypothetical protein